MKGNHDVQNFHEKFVSKKQSPSFTFTSLAKSQLRTQILPLPLMAPHFASLFSFWDGNPKQFQNLKERGLNWRRDSDKESKTLDWWMLNFYINWAFNGDEGAKRKKTCTEGITWLTASNVAVLCQISSCSIWGGREWPQFQHRLVLQGVVLSHSSFHDSSALRWFTWFFIQIRGCFVYLWWIFQFGFLFDDICWWI